MKLKLKFKKSDILFFGPSLLLFLYSITYPYWLTLIWCDFFQTRSAPTYFFRLLTCLAVAWLCVILMLLVKAGYFFYLLIKRRWSSLIDCLIKLMLMLLIPFVGVFFPIHFSESRMLIPLKSSLEKENVNFEKVATWLNSLDKQTIALHSHMWLDESFVPTDIQETLLPLKADVISLRVSIDNCPYMDLVFITRPYPKNVRIIIGIDSESMPSPPENERQTIELSDTVFIWVG